MNKIFTINLHCGLCGVVIGKVAVESEFGWTKETATEAAYNTKHSVVDHRCSACETTHGKFADLAKLYEHTTGKSPQEAEDFVKAHRKSADFHAALDKKGI